MLRIATLAAAATIGPASPAHDACASTPYAYAGLVGGSASAGVRATITALRAPALLGGHIAAWVGVGGPGLGPDGADEWLQTGISGEPGRGLELYYELALPGRAARYVRLGWVRAGAAHRVAVVEARPGTWRVVVDGMARTRAIALPGSHGAWRPVATSESWNGDAGICNAFSFRFANVVARISRGWRRLQGTWLAAPASRVLRRSDGFVAFRPGG